MDYAIVPQANTLKELQDKRDQLINDKATQEKYSKMEVKLWESQRGGEWKWEGKPYFGKGYDQLSNWAGSADQRWYIDGKRVQLVVGVDTKGQLIKAWTVRVVETKIGPQFSRVE